MCEITETQKQVIELLSDNCQHSWYSLIEKTNQRPPLVTTALIRLLEIGKVGCKATEIDIFYFLIN